MTTPAEMKALGEGVKELSINQTLKGLYELPMLVARARLIAKTDENMAETIHRYDADIKPKGV